MEKKRRRKSTWIFVFFCSFSFMGTKKPILKRRKKNQFFFSFKSNCDIFTASEHLIKLFCQTIWMSRNKRKTRIVLESNKKWKEMNIYVYTFFIICVYILDKIKNEEEEEDDDDLFII